RTTIRPVRTELVRRLYVLRHGIAYPHGTPVFGEDERPLTPKGARQMKKVAKALRRLGVAPDRIVTSPLTRARQTAEIVAGVLGLGDRLEQADALRADRPAASIRSWLEGQPGDAVMIVGHNPALSDLLSVLPIGEGAPPLGELDKGGIACFSVEGPGGYRLEWLATAELMRRVRRLRRTRPAGRGTRGPNGPRPAEPDGR